MKFYLYKSKPNQILVSRSYYEVTSRLTQEISQMFDYSGIKQDKHVREHEVYSVRLLKEQTVDENNIIVPIEDLIEAPIIASKKINWKYVALAAPALVAFFLMIKLANNPVVPKITLDPAVALAQADTTTFGQVKTPEKTSSLGNVSTKNTNTKNMSNSALMPNETLESVPQPTTLALAKKDATEDIALQAKAPDELLEIELAKKKAKQKAKKKVDEQAIKNAPSELPHHGSVVQNQEVIAAKTEVKKDSMQQSSSKVTVKQVGDSKCSQAQIAMNQCN